VHLGYLGAVPRDDYLRKAVQQQAAVVQAYPRSQSAVALNRLAVTIDDRFKTGSDTGGLGFFVERLISCGNLALDA